MPSWEDAPKSDKIAIELDPGLAFGTGQHPTTRMCLELLGELELKGKNLLDVGCGSGILSIAAAKLGARVVGFRFGRLVHRRDRRKRRQKQRFD